MFTSVQLLIHDPFLFLYLPALTLPLHCAAPPSVFALCLAFCPPTSPPAFPQQKEGGHQQGRHVLPAGEKPEAELGGLQHDGAEHPAAG